MSDWKHTTALTVHGDGKPAAGIDLFDDEVNAEGKPTVSIYMRFSDGTRWPARTITPGASNFHECLTAWTLDGGVNDYRKKP